MNSDEVKWADLSKDEQEFLRAWHAADDSAKLYALQMLLNNQRRRGDGQVIPFPTTPRDDE